MYPSIYGCSSYHISDTYPRGKNFRFRFRAYVYVTLLSADWLFAFAGFIKRPSAYAEHRWIRWNKFLKVTQCVCLSVKCYLKKRKSFKIPHPKIDKLVTQFIFVCLFFCPHTLPSSSHGHVSRSICPTSLIFTTTTTTTITIDQCTNCSL